jgi:hypothetical protein
LYVSALKRSLLLWKPTLLNLIEEINDPIVIAELSRP